MLASKLKKKKHQEQLQSPYLKVTDEINVTQSAKENTA